MKRSIIAALALLLTAPALRAQTTEIEVDEKKNKVRITVGTDGIKAGKSEGKKEEDRFDLHYGMVDLGFNRIHEPGDLRRQSGGADLAQPAAWRIDGEYLPLREGKSVNVNVYPLMLKWRMSAEKHRKSNVYLTSGIGFQLYNFRFERGYNYTDQPTVRLQNFDSLRLEKNKLAFNYLTIPLGLLGKTRIAGKTNLVYGAGLMGGYRLSSWTKLKTHEGEKPKNHDNFAFQDFNACATAELGVEGYLRLYATYQLTPLHMDGTGLDQRPFCIGVRFLGL
jgi:hypothetical protein